MCLGIEVRFCNRAVRGKAIHVSENYFARVTAGVACLVVGCGWQFNPVARKFKATRYSNRGKVKQMVHIASKLSVS